MWELIQSNRRKSAALIVILALVLAALGLSIGWSIAGEEGGYFGVAVAMIIWIVMLVTNLVAGESILLSAAGGREVTLRELQSMGMTSGINALIVGNYLTTLGRPAGEDLDLLSELEMPVSKLTQTQ